VNPATQTPAACNTGSIQQQFECGLHNSHAYDVGAHAGHVVGPGVMPFILVVLTVLVLIALARRGRSGSPATRRS